MDYKLKVQANVEVSSRGNDMYVFFSLFSFFFFVFLLATFDLTNRDLLPYLSISRILSLWYRLDYQPLFGKISPHSLGGLELLGGKTFCASFHASLIAGSRRAFLCVDCVCLLLEFWVKCTRCERLLPVKHFSLTCLLFFRHLKITFDSEQPMLKEKRIIPSLWGGIKGFEHF